MEVEKVSHKRHRKRSSNLMLQIRQQMEFYFSDSNLNKDRFLKQQLEQAADGYLPLEMFLNFNKIRAMTGDVSNLAKALSKSQLLQVNEDLLKVRRTTEIRKPTDIDDRTVYVECLPAGVNHDWVKEAFSECGKVLYVSLPKYKTSGDIKGFAFVEFDSRESADKACAIMNNPPATAPELVGIFPRAGKEEKRLEKQVERLEKSSEKRKRRASESELNGDKSDKSQSKRRRTESSGGGDKIELTSSADSVHPKTKTKSDSKSDNSAETNTSSFVAVSSDKEEGSSDFVGKKNKKRKQEQQSSAADNVADGCDKTIDAIKCVSPPDSLPEPKKKRKQMTQDSDEKQKEGNKSSDPDHKENKSVAINKKNVPSADSIDEAAAGTEKKKRRHSCEGVADSNNISKKPRIEECTDDTESSAAPNGSGVATEETEEVDSKKKNRPKKNQPCKEKNDHADKAIPELRVITKKDWLLRRSEYLAQQKENMTKLKEKLHCLTGPSKSEKLPEQKNPKDKSKAGTTVELKPGTVVKIVTSQPVARKDIKESLGKLGSIAYVDVIDGTMAAHVRCNDAESAQKISAAAVDGYEMMLLSGVEEESYWKKLEADRALKLNTKSRSKRRGRDRVLAKADQCQDNKPTKHIVFE